MKHHTQTGSARKINLITIASIIILLAFVVSMLPRGYSEDVSKIGQGSRIAVLVHNKDSVASLKMMGLMDQVRSAYADKVEFLVVDTAIEKGNAFARQNSLNSSTLVLYNPSGEKINTLANLQNESELSKALDEGFQLVP